MHGMAWHGMARHSISLGVPRGRSVVGVSSVC